MQIFPPIIIACGPVAIVIHLPLCFEGNTTVKVLENGKEVEKEIKDVKKDEMVLVHNGKEKRYAKVEDNKITEGDFEFYVVKVRDLKDSSKTKEITITPEHNMIILDENKNIKLVSAMDLKDNEIMDSEDGLCQIYEISKKTLKNKYSLSVKGGCVLANGIFTSSICSENNAQLLKPTLKDWKKYHSENYRDNYVRS